MNTPLLNSFIPARLNSYVMLLVSQRMVGSDTRPVPRGRPRTLRYPSVDFDLLLIPTWRCNEPFNRSQDVCETICATIVHISWPAEFRSNSDSERIFHECDKQCFHLLFLTAERIPLLALSSTSSIHSHDWPSTAFIDCIRFKDEHPSVRIRCFWQDTNMF